MAGHRRFCPGNGKAVSQQEALERRPAEHRTTPAPAVQDLPRAGSGAAVRFEASNTPLRIPFGNKETAQKLGARYGAGGWYAPPGVGLDPFRERGWM